MKELIDNMDSIEKEANKKYDQMCAIQNPNVVVRRSTNDLEDHMAIRL